MHINIHILNLGADKYFFHNMSLSNLHDNERKTKATIKKKKVSIIYFQHY